MIEKRIAYYNRRVADNQLLLSRIRRRIYSFGTLRLFLVLVVCSLFFFFHQHFTVYFYGILFLSLLIFLWLVTESSKLSRKKNYLKTSILSDEHELKAFNYNFKAYDGAPERITGEHPFSLDLDLFGTDSFFQSINRTCTPWGQEILATWFEQPLREKKPILERQESVREIAAQPDKIHHFEVTGLLHPGKLSDLYDLKSFAAQAELFKYKKGWNVLSYVVPLIWVVVIILSFQGFISGSLFSWIYILFFAISESRFKKVSFLQLRIGKKMKILNTYSDLIQVIEKWAFVAPLLSELKSVFQHEDLRVSQEIKKLARLSGDLEQRSNMLVHLILNPFLLWDVRKSIAIENWKEKHGRSLENWLRTLGEFDAYCSLGKYAFNHPGYTYPEIADHYFELEGKGLGHPLLHRDVCVKNDIDITSASFFMIVTGANMAGKSTYLRTVGVNFLLACIGAPVCAESLRIYPAKLFTSLRTSDSLTHNESYFFAELKRLKRIIDELKGEQELFIILDEILKGTNSVDKQKGSLALVSQLVHMKSSGIIATHDLMLGSLEKEFPQHIKNYHFDADITNDELVFAYQLKTGIAQNMNACFLMNKMGITVKT